MAQPRRTRAAQTSGDGPDAATVQRYREIAFDLGSEGPAKLLGYEKSTLDLRVSDDYRIAVVQPAPGREKDGGGLVGTQLMYVTDDVPLAANICKRVEDGARELNLGGGKTTYYPVVFDARRVMRYDDCRNVALSAMETIHSKNNEEVILKSLDKSATHRITAKNGEKAVQREDLSKEEVDQFKPPEPRKPKVGEVLAILYRDSRKRREDVDWNYHYATVIAASGGDLVTIENYRGRDPRTWYVQLYGPDKQSYDVQWAGSGEFGRAALTYIFELEKLELETKRDTDLSSRYTGHGGSYTPTPRQSSFWSSRWTQGLGALVVVGLGLGLRYYLQRKT
jgi:hypothetical protein